MKTITDKSSQDSSFSFSRRYFHWKKKVEGEDDDQEQEEILTFSSSSHHDLDIVPTSLREPWKKLPVVAVSKLKSAFTGFGKSKSSLNRRLGTKVVGTLFGYRRGHVHFAFQEDPKLNPAFLVELATPTSVLVREMASGVVRIALECEKKAEKKKKKGLKLLEEPLWRTYCNGKKYGYATRRRCAEEDWAVLDAVGPVTMGAGVLPGDGGGEGVGAEGEVMYMRARFERAVGSKDSEAFYMMNPDGHGGPELSIYLLRV